MAILMSFHKQHEDADTVTYRVRPDPDRQDQTLVFDKRAPEAPLQPVDRPDRATTIALGMILHEYRTTGNWPQHGNRQS